LAPGRKVKMRSAKMSFYDEFKKIRNRISKYSKISIFRLCMDGLMQVWNLHLLEVVQKKLPVPMHLLLMLKWGLIYGENHRLAKKEFGHSEFANLYNEFTQLSALSDLLKEEDPLAFGKYSRAVMSHQLNYQQKSGLHGLVLLETLFCRIGLDYNYDRTLNSICGLSVKEFIDFQMIVLEAIGMEKNYRSFEISYFHNLFAEYGKDKIFKFLQFLSCDFQQLEDFLRNDHKRINNPEYEYALLSALYQKPLLRDGDRYTPYHTALIQSNIEFGIYDILKKSDASAFCSPFGRAFEEYISLSLKSNGIDHWREDNIREHTHRDSACDFLVYDDKSIVFIEAKSAEMYYLTRQNPQKEFLERTLQNSLISGYEQIITLADYLKNKNDPIFEGKSIFGIIVTFKDLLLGHPPAIWQEFMMDFMGEKLDKRISTNLPIDPANIFVISAYDFDHMLAYSTKFQKSLSNCLEIAYVNNASLDNNKFFFHDNFDDDSINVIESSLLSDSFKGITSRIGDALRKGQDAS
jgi:hypothetical protein